MNDGSQNGNYQHVRSAGEDGSAGIFYVWREAAEFSRLYCSSERQANKKWSRNGLVGPGKERDSSDRKRTSRGERGHKAQSRMRIKIGKKKRGDRKEKVVTRTFAIARSQNPHPR